MGLLDSIQTVIQFDRVDEALAVFQKKGDYAVSDRELLAQRGEGFGFYPIEQLGISSFNIFYNRELNQRFATEVSRIRNYRSIAEMAEISDVIENAVIESTQEDFEGNILTLKIEDDKLEKNQRVSQILEDEFHDFFYNKLRISERISDYFRTYFIDGRFFYERLIDKNDESKGIVGIKKLPSETMDFDYDYVTGRVKKYYQYLKEEAITRGKSRERAIADKEIIEFNPEQIGLVDYGIYGRVKNEIFGYLEKVKVPYNQLKLLETSVVIYRIIRAPERLVFRIDVGNMPRDSAMKYVNKVKTEMARKQSYDPTTGRLTQTPNVFSIIENFFVAQSADGRGSSVESIGGQGTAGFTELDDIYYFQRKLYQALKYPSSRISAMHQRAEADILFSRNPAGEISRDEILWATFLQRQQNRFCVEFLNLFLLHLEFKGLKKQYNLSRDNLSIKMNQPSYFKDRQEQLILETRFSNYLQLANQQEFSKFYLMKRFLEMTEEEIQENADGFEKDKELGFAEQPEDVPGFGAGQGEFPQDGPGQPETPPTSQPSGAQGGPREPEMI